MKNKIETKIGKTNTSNQGCSLKIVAYRDERDIDVLIDDKYLVKNVLYKSFINGTVKNMYFPSVSGVGYLGVGPYRSTENGNDTPAYSRWKGILRRCYDENRSKAHETYQECNVCEEWLCYQSFAKWYEENFYQVPGNKMDIDKDILIKGNKEYGPKTCIFVPKIINKLVMTNRTKRGEMPVGVRKKVNYSTVTGEVNSVRYYAQHSVKFEGEKKKRISLGSFETPELAYKAYKESKEKHIKSIADCYKNEIPQKLYDALYRYEISIDD